MSELKPNEKEFEYNGETHVYEHKPLTMPLLMLVENIEENETPLDVLLLRRVDGQPAHKVESGLRLIAGLMCMDFLSGVMLQYGKQASVSMLDLPSIERLQTAMPRSSQAESVTA